MLLLSEMLRSAKASGRIKSVIEIQMLQALTLFTQGNSIGAMQLLENALVLAEPEGYIRIFVDEGAPMVELLRSLVADGISQRYATRLLSAFDKDILSGKNSPVVLAEPLTKREREVLLLLSSGVSNKDIANKFQISLSTAKTHLRRIYRKLDVHNRTQAVAKAGELGLL